MNRLLQIVACLAVLMVTLNWFLSEPSTAAPDDEELTLFPTRISKQDETEIAQARQTCDQGEAVDATVYVKGRVPLRATPAMESMVVVNRKLYAETGQVSPRELSSVVGLRTLCLTPAWVKVKVISIGLAAYSGESGWVPKANLTEELDDNQKKGLFWDITADRNILEWDRPRVVAKSLAILATVPECGLILSGGVANPPRPQAPFYATCTGHPTQKVPSTSFEKIF